MVSQDKNGIVHRGAWVVMVLMAKECSEVRATGWLSTLCQAHS
jgi:hypothetical protein